MGSLATAGLISGLGSGLGRGLEQLQSGIIQEGLLNRRSELDDARAERTMAADQAFRMKMMDKQQGYESALTDKKIAADAGLAQQRMGAEIVGRSSDHLAAAEQNKLKMDQDREFHRDSKGLKEKELGFENTNKNRQLANEEKKTKIEEGLANAHAEYYKAFAGLKDRSPASGTKGNSGVGKVMDLNKEMIQEYIKLRPMASPEEQQDIDEQIATLREHSMQLAGVGQSPSAETEIKDRFGKSPITKGK